MQTQFPQLVDFQQLIDGITPAIHANLKTAIETGKWPDGRALNAEQRELCMQAVIAYELKNIPEHERTGFIDRGSKVEGEQCGDDHDHAEHDTPQTIQWR